MAGMRIGDGRGSDKSVKSLWYLLSEMYTRYEEGESWEQMTKMMRSRLTRLGWVYKERTEPFVERNTYLTRTLVDGKVVCSKSNVDHEVIVGLVKEGTSVPKASQKLGVPEGTMKKWMAAERKIQGIVSPFNGNKKKGVV